MNKIICLIFIVYGLTFAQSELIIIMGDVAGYDNAETTIYTDALTTALEDTQATNVDQLITMLKDSLSITSLSTFFEQILLKVNQTAEAGLKNIVQRSFDADTIGGVTFTQWEGFQNTLNSTFINSNFNPSSDASIITQDDISIGFYSRTTTVDDGIDFGLKNGSSTQINLTCRYTGDHTYARLNSENGDYSDYTNSDGSGLYILSRVADNQFVVYKNGVAVETQASVSTAFTNGEIGSLGQNDINATYLQSFKQCALFFIAKGLSAEQARKINNCFEWYLDEIGAGVQ